MRVETVTIEVAPQLAATLLTLQQKAEVEGKTLNTFLRELTEKYTAEKKQNDLTSTKSSNSPFEIVQHIIVSIDNENVAPL